MPAVYSHQSPTRSPAWQTVYLVLPTQSVQTLRPWKRWRSSTPSTGKATAIIDSSNLDELATELGMSTEEVERLITAGANIGSIQFNEAAAGAGELESSVSSADTAVEDLGSDLDIINSSMLLQLSEQVGQVGAQAEGMAQDMNTAAISVGQLDTQTGIAEPQMVSLINNISNECDNDFR